MKKIINFFNHWIVAMIVVSTFVTVITWIFGAEKPYLIGAITFMGMGVLNILFVWGRQFYWWVTSSGDYEKDKKS
jgi:energy-coupling factor transporter transmembrane protein EcfT